jgi:starch synthase (maltosyl-transferring)
MSLDAPGIDRWSAAFAVGRIGKHEYSIEAWVDHFASWQRDLSAKAEAGQDVSLEMIEGSVLVQAAAERADRISRNRSDAAWLLARADALQEDTPIAGRLRIALDDELTAVMGLHADRSQSSTSQPLIVWVDRERARFGAWYEMFPRSAGPELGRSATFREAAGRLPGIVAMGFDVLYLPPIHPIGKSFRKGRNNSLVASPDDLGSPWAIGAEEGGHTAVEPGLGTIDDFDLFRSEAERLGLEIALDLAWQCSPDHPWVREHPEWFRRRPDGTIKYAENPPKKYQDIYPVDFACEDWRSLWQAALEVVLFWIDHDVRLFRVDNPHTKTFGFWEWLIEQVHLRDQQVIFLSEAFTRPRIMQYLAKAGFTQSYTYFTWRNTKQEITDYFTELTSTDVREYLRPNLFTNTPDILHAYLQTGGRPAFQARLLLAATLGANYGIYSGFEVCENQARPGTEEYADSEKYQIRHWDWNKPENIRDLIARVNAIRHAHPALQFDWTLRFHATDNPEIIAYSKTSPDRSEVLLVVVSLDPHNMQQGQVRAPTSALSLSATGDDSYVAWDLLDDAKYTWRGEWNYVRLDPGTKQGHIFKLGIRN